MTLLETVKLELDTLPESMLPFILGTIRHEKRMEKLGWDAPDDAAEKTEEHTDEHRWEQWWDSLGKVTPDFMRDYEKPMDDNKRNLNW